MRIKIVLITIGVIVSLLSVFLNPFVVVRKSEVKAWKINAYNDSVSVVKLSRENIVQDSLLWSIQQDLDIYKAIDKKHQIVISGLTAENKRLRNTESICCEELKMAEKSGGVIRDTVRLNWLGRVKKKK